MFEDKIQKNTVTTRSCCKFFSGYNQPTKAKKKNTTTQGKLSCDIFILKQEKKTNNDAQSKE